MTKAEAKRKTCMHASGIIASESSGLGDHDEYDDWSEADKGRFHDALDEIADELQRRATRLTTGETTDR
jgi:hypothetical protein